MKQPANTSSIIDYNSVIPLYEQVANALRADIQGGAFDATKRLPTEEELAEKYGISRITVRRAVGDLVEEGLVEKKQGKGTFIRTPSSACALWTMSPASLRKTIFPSNIAFC